MRISDLAILLQRKASLSDPQLVVRNPAAKDRSCLARILLTLRYLATFISVRAKASKLASLLP